MVFPVDGAAAAKTLAAKGSAHRAYRHASAEMLWICVDRCRQDGSLYGRYPNARAVSSVSASGLLLIYRTSAIQSGVHLYVQDVLPRLKALSEQGVSVFLMHLDCEEEISRQIQGTAIQLAPLYSSFIHPLACGKGE